jgi:hypothetical protein
MILDEEHDIKSLRPPRGEDPLRESYGSLPTLIFCECIHNLRYTFFLWIILVVTRRKRIPYEKVMRVLVKTLRSGYRPKI